MSGTKVRMALFILVVLGLAGLCHFVVNHKSAEKEKLASPPLDRTVAEGFRLWNPKAGVDSVSFESLMERTGLYAKRFSGIRVDGLSVNRVVNRSVVPVFAAKTMKNRGKSLELTNCRVFADDGSTNLVAKAMLRLKPVPALVWNGGERRLDDLLK